MATPSPGIYCSEMVCGDTQATQPPSPELSPGHWPPSHQVCLCLWGLRERGDHLGKGRIHPERWGPAGRGTCTPPWGTFVLLCQRRRDMAQVLVGGLGERSRGHGGAHPICNPGGQ